MPMIDRGTGLQKCRLGPVDDPTPVSAHPTLHGVAPTIFVAREDEAGELVHIGPFTTADAAQAAADRWWTALLEAARREVR